MNHYLSTQDLPAGCPGGTLYTIKPGDSLFSLASRFKTTVQALLTANPGIQPTGLQLGQIICIPVPATSKPCEGGFQYSIKSGDTIYSIAQKYSIPVAALLAANPGISPYALYITQQICIPAPAPIETSCPGRLYTVMPGDTFYGIARRFGYTLDALLTVNPTINSNVLQTGQIICLPPAPGGGPFPCPGGSIYILKPGDTLYSIAKRRGIPLSALLAANPQISDIRYLKIGDPICIPA